MLGWDWLHANGMDKKFVPWPEVSAPTGVDCTQFGLGGHGRLVWGEGYPGAPLMIVLDNPGARENRSGEPYVCGTRQTLRRALHRAGWSAATAGVVGSAGRGPLGPSDPA